jgi:hypothetical protein
VVTHPLATAMTADTATRHPAIITRASTDYLRDHLANLDAILAVVMPGDAQMSEYRDRVAAELASRGAL